MEANLSEQDESYSLLYATAWCPSTVKTTWDTGSDAASFNWFQFAPVRRANPIGIYFGMWSCANKANDPMQTGCELY